MQASALPRIAIGLLTLWFLAVLGFAWHIHADFVSRDQWHFLDLLDHFLSGSLDWRELWHSHSEQVKPGYELLFLLNGKYLGLNLMAEIMVGLLLLGAAALLLWRDMAASLDGKINSLAASLALLAAGLVLMSFNQWANYVYSLLALGGFAGMLVQLGFFSGFSRLLNQGQNTRGLIAMAVLLVLAVLGFSGARSPAFIGACTACFLLALWFKPAERRQVTLQALPFLILGCAFIGIYLLLLGSGRTSGGSLAADLSRLLLHPLGAVGYVAGIVAQSMLSLLEAPKSWRGVLQPVLAIAGFAALGWALWRYFAAGLWRKTWMPLLLILYSALFVLEVLVGRFGGENLNLRGSAVPRYVFDAHLWVVGVVWIAGLEWSEETRFTPRRALVPALVIALFMCLELWNLQLAWHFAPYMARNSARSVETLQEIAAGQKPVSALSRTVCPNIELCAHGMEILEKYHLNVLRDVAPNDTHP